VEEFDEERFTPTNEVEAKCDQEVWVRVASDVLIAEVGIEAESGSVLATCERVAQWEKGVSSLAAAGDKSTVALVTLRIAPDSQRRHVQVAELKLSIAPPDPKAGTTGEEKVRFEVFASNISEGRRKAFAGPAVGGSVQHSARVGHRRVVFQIHWPEARQVVLTLADCGQVPSVIGYRGMGLSKAEMVHTAAVNTPIKLFPVHREPDPNDQNPLSTEDWSIRPSLPPGMEVKRDGTIAGAPTSCQLPRHYEVTASNSAGIEKVRLVLEVVLTEKERRRVMEFCTKELTNPSVNLPGTTEDLDYATARAMHGTCAREIERVVSHIPAEMVKMKDEIVRRAPRCTMRTQKIGSLITFARRQQYLIPRDFDTIQEAIAQCPVGHSGGAHIWVLPGQYDGPVFIDRPVVIEATAPGAEILSAGKPAVWVEKGGENSVVRKISLVRTTLHGTKLPGESVRVSAGRPTIEQCRVNSENGACFLLEGKTDALITECVIFPPYDRTDGAGVVALHDACGRVIGNIFCTDGCDVQAAATAKLHCEGNTNNPVYGVEATSFYELATADDGSKYLSSVASQAVDSVKPVRTNTWAQFDDSVEPKPIDGDVLDAKLFGCTYGKSWPKSASAPALVKPAHIADGDFNWRKEVTAWNPMTTYTREELRDKHIRQTDLSCSRGPVLKGILKGKERKKRPPRLVSPELMSHGSPTFQLTEPLSPLSATSQFVLSPTSPKRSQHGRTQSSSTLSPKGTREHTDRQKPSVHPTVWDHKVVWKQAPAVRMPQRAPGPQTLRMHTFQQPAKKLGSGYGVGGHGGAIQHVAIY
jgi:hypothetical protein